MKKNTSSERAQTAHSAERSMTVAATTQEMIGTSRATKHHAVVGLDVGDRHTHYCVLDLDGAVVAEGVAATKDTSLRLQFEGKPRLRIALEVGTHSPWVSRLLTALGHDVLVANPRKVRLISENDSKHDRADARLLARLAHVGPALLSPIHHRSAQVQTDLALVRARESRRPDEDGDRQCRTGHCEVIRQRLPGSPTVTFAQKARTACPDVLNPSLPLLRLVEALTHEF